MIMSSNVKRTSRMVLDVTKPSGEGNDKEAKHPPDDDQKVSAQWSSDHKRNKGGSIPKTTQARKKVTKKPNTHMMLIGQLPFWIVRLTQWLLDHTREKERSITKKNVSLSLL